ncbi:MAG: hypothetical protein IH898_09030 [Planctomycetes bacterium]|nr:hypothetical protein [Planctomycetota bacterium]
MAPFNEQLEIFTHRATESEVLVEMCDMSQGRIHAFQGQLRGPHCERARTLPATFQASHREPLLVIDPCYWTPQLPMLYDVQLALELADGTTATWKHTVGLRRWEIDGRNLLQERRRIVLRGAVTTDFRAEDLSAAVAAEVALVVRDPSEAFLQRASELGVSLVVDLRGQEGNLSSKLLSYAWQPAVALVLLDTDVASAPYKPHAVKTGCVIQPACVFAEAPWADVIAIELSETERPPDWAATCEKPVIAIRSQGAYAELAEARHGCDLLQADLAPQFSLAGYFV